MMRKYRINHMPEEYLNLLEILKKELENAVVSKEVKRTNINITKVAYDK